MKYKLTKESKQWADKTLFRIEAISALGSVSKGDKGGWIEKEENLSQGGNSWVSGDAWVYGNARVYGLDEDYELIYKGDAKIEQGDDNSEKKAKILAQIEELKKEAEKL